MYSYGRRFKFDDKQRGLTDSNKRNNIDWAKIDNEYITIDTAYKMNKEYKMEASDTLMAVRNNCWYWQYWLLIVSMILMYPSPILSDVTKKHPEAADRVDTAIFWLFWSGIYVSPSNTGASVSHGPLYILIAVLVIDKITQGWH